MLASSLPLSIEQYALFILNDERVIATLRKIDASNRMNDRFMTISLEDVSDDELAYIARYRKSLTASKEKSLLHIIRQSMPDRWLYLNNLDDIAHNVIAGEPSYKDLPIIMLHHFASYPEFRVYLLERQLPWFGPLPSERTQQFAFSLFLWLKMDARYDKETGHSYYVKAVDIQLQPIAKGSRFIPPTVDRRIVSTITDRLNFIELFKEYIHSDVWTSSDYDKQEKQGIVLRLRLSDSVTGQIVIQECGEKSSKCNKLYLVTETTIKKLQVDYLDQGRLLCTSQGVVSPTLTFQCRQCGSHDASHFPIPLAKTLHFYCDYYCFVRSNKTIQ